MSRFPFRRPARWRKPPPPPAVPHIIESMDSHLYPLRERGNFAYLTAPVERHRHWPSAAQSLRESTLPSLGVEAGPLTYRGVWLSPAPDRENVYVFADPGTERLIARAGFDPVSGPFGTGAETTTWPRLGETIHVSPEPPFDTLPDVPPIPYRPRSQSMTEQNETDPPTETDLTASPVDAARQAVANAAEAFRRGYDADSTEPEPDSGRELCQHCRGTGMRMTTNDLLRESIALLEGNEDVVVRTFYDHLLRQAPDLAPLFPPDLLDPLSPPIGNLPGEFRRSGRGQRDKLVAALAALATTYDPGDPEKMEVLDTHLAAFGRAHAAFRRPNGTVRGATVSEYHAVKVTLFATLHDAAAEAWLPEYDDAWDEAYEYAARHMLAAQDSVDRPFGRYPRS